MKSKAVSGIMLTLLFMGMLTLVFNIQPAKAEPTTWTVDDDGPADFQRIQEAINTASPRDTIYVYDGTYYEQVVVNKSVSLIGEDEIATVIIANLTDYAVYISANNVTLSGFEIHTVSEGIFLNHSSNSVVSKNVITAMVAIRVEGGSENHISDNRVLGPYGCVPYGLILENSDNNVVTGNYLDGSCHTSLTLSNSHNNYIASNYLSNHLLYSIKMSGSNNNSIVGNTIDFSLISLGGHAYLAGSNGNVLYHNSFLTYGEDVGPVIIYVHDGSVNNIWDNGYPFGGNYWENYTGVDLYSGPYQNETGSDGIGDTPYTIDADNQDNYPFMSPWEDVEPPVADAGPDLTVALGTTATFDGTKSIDDVAIKSYVWTFTDITPQTLTGMQPEYTFNNVGDFEVTLNVSDYANNWNTDTVTIAVVEGYTLTIYSSPTGQRLQLVVYLVQLLGQEPILQIPQLV